MFPIDGILTDQDVPVGALYVTCRILAHTRTPPVDFGFPHDSVRLSVRIAGIEAPLNQVRVELNGQSLSVAGNGPLGMGFVTC